MQTTVMQEAARWVSRQPRAALSLAVVRELQARHRELHARDLANVDAGLYPRELLFALPMREYARQLPRLLRDAPNVVRRQKAGNFRDIPPVDKSRYPAYYRRTFHWQTDGYFSTRSAESLRRRRRAVVPRHRRRHAPADRPADHAVRARCRRRRASRVRLLDVACGTGRTLRQLATTHPTMRLTGVDLSPAYVQVARQRLADLVAAGVELSLVADNAEALPYRDASFDIATSVFLFHELPRNARRNVARELFRVVRPGGLVVIEDSAQLADSDTLATVLHEFPREFHEPFYADYIADELAAMLREVGFVIEGVESPLVAKVVVARRP